MTPLILDKEEKGDDTDDHGKGYEHDDDQATIHHHIGLHKYPILKI